VSKYAALLLAFLFVCFSGCGGGSGGGSQSLSISIESTRFFPKTLNISTGDRVTWINVDQNPHQVVSGVLLATPNPVIRNPISIRPDNTFDPEVIEVNLGDTVRWRNDRAQPFTMDVVDDASVTVASLVFNTGQVIGYSSFPAAGVYRYQQRNNPLFRGIAFVYGTPTPNGLFESVVLFNGGTFTRQFNAPGTYTFYDLNQSDPKKSFMTGTIVVQ